MTNLIGLTELESLFSQVKERVGNMLDQLPDPTNLDPKIKSEKGVGKYCSLRAFPVYPKGGKNWTLVDQTNWMFGNFAGILWLITFLSEYMDGHGEVRNNWEEKASKWTELLEKKCKDEGKSCDPAKTQTILDTSVSGQVYRSYGLGLRIGKFIDRPKYINIIKNAGLRYLKKFDQDKGYFKSGLSNYKNKHLIFPVLIDQLLALEFAAWMDSMTADAGPSTMALTHAQKTIRSHLGMRCGGQASYHLVDIGDGNGRVYGDQGYSADSAWSRGQAWVIEGLSSLYGSLSSDKKPLKFPDVIDKTVEFLKSKTSDFKQIPKWDVCLPPHPAQAYSPWDYVDTSAAAAVAAGLFTLAFATGESKHQSDASDIFQTLKEDYFPGSEKGLLDHGCYINPLCEQVRNTKRKGEAADSPLMFGDFYFMKCLVWQYCLLTKIKNPFGYHEKN